MVRQDHRHRTGPVARLVDLVQTNTVTVLLSREEAEAGDLGLEDSRDPRSRACSAQPAQPLLLPMPLFPFLPHPEGNTYDSPSTSPGK